MAKRMKVYVIAPDSESEVSGVRSRPEAAVDTARVPRVDLERLLEEERERLRAEEPELGSDFPPPMPELTSVMKYTPVPIPPPPLPPFEAMRAARHQAQQTKRIVVAIWAVALTVAASLGYVVASQS